MAPIALGCPAPPQPQCRRRQGSWQGRSMRFIESLHQSPCRVPLGEHQSWGHSPPSCGAGSSLHGPGAPSQVLDVTGTHFLSLSPQGSPATGCECGCCSQGCCIRAALQGWHLWGRGWGASRRHTPCSPPAPQGHCMLQGGGGCMRDVWAGGAVPPARHRELAGDGTREGREQDAARTFRAAHGANAQHHHADEVIQGHEAMSPCLQCCWSTAGRALSLGARGGCGSPLALVWFSGKHLGHPSGGPCLQWVWAGAEPPQGAHGTEDTWPPGPLPLALGSEAGALVVQPADLREAAVPAVRVPAGTPPCQSPPPPTAAAAAGAAAAGAAAAAPVLIDGDLDLGTAKEQPWDASATAPLPAAGVRPPSSPLSQRIQLSCHAPEGR